MLIDTTFFYVFLTNVTDINVVPVVKPFLIGTDL